MKTNLGASYAMELVGDYAKQAKTYEIQIVKGVARILDWNVLSQAFAIS